MENMEEIRIKICLKKKNKYRYENMSKEKKKIKTILKNYLETDKNKNF